jgi:uncharacterized protein (DUF433 family)
MQSGPPRRTARNRQGEEKLMSFADRIVVDSAILVGKPCVRGTRLSVDFLLGLFAQGWVETEILRNYPGLIREDLLACFEYATEMVGREKVYPYRVADVGASDAVLG